MNILNLGITVVMVLVVFAFVYFPKKKENELLKKMQEELKEGDKIITYSGLSGTISKIEKEEKVWVKLYPKDIEVSIEKWAIAGIDERAETQTKEE